MNRSGLGRARAGSSLTASGVGDHDHVRELVAGLECLEGGDDRGRLGLVAREAADLRGNPPRLTSRPTTTCGSARRSLENPTLRRSSLA
jgi:hypothetical protein